MPFREFIEFHGPESGTFAIGNISYILSNCHGQSCYQYSYYANSRCIDWEAIALAKTLKTKASAGASLFSNYSGMHIPRLQHNAFRF